MIYFSNSAAVEIQRLQSKHLLKGFLRLSVEASGCSGLAYRMAFEAENQPSDRFYESNGVQVIVDPDSFDSIKGLTLDYTEDLMGGGFRFHNPNATQTCGCGNSFALGT